MSFSQWYERICYRRETGYLLNHITLSVRDPDTRQDIYRHQARMISSLLAPMITMSLVMTSYQILDYLVFEKGFLISVVIALVQLCLLSVFTALQLAEYYRLTQYVISTIFIFHSVVTVLFFWEMLPEAL